MTEKLINLILTEPQRKILTGTDILLWIVLTLTSFDRIFFTIDFNSISHEKLDDFVFSGNFIPFVSWCIILVITFGLIKIFLLRFIANTKFVFISFVHFSVGDGYKKTILKTFYRGINKLNHQQILLLSNYLNNEKIESLSQRKIDINLLLNIKIKLILILIISLFNFSGLEFILCLVSLVILLFTLFILITGFTSVKTKLSIFKTVNLNLPKQHP